MKAIVMGCGRLGEQVCRLLADGGHDVRVIDYNPEALERLGPEVNVKKITGVGFDRDVLIEAGIRDADAFVSTSASDNANIIAARIARNIFCVPKVVARLYDPRRAEIYRRLGLITISATNWAAERVRELLLHAELDSVMAFGKGEVALINIEAPPPLYNRTVKHISVSGEINVVAITRRGQAFIPALGSEVQEGDILHLAVLATSMNQVEVLLGMTGGML
ncbi:MAG: potassium channel family protein [Chloroflexota bacterium]